MFNLEIKNFSKKKISFSLLNRVANYLAHYLKLKGELSLVLAGDYKLRSLNKKFRNKDKSTDILTFSDDLNDYFLGEIFINLNDCQRSYKYKDIFDTPPSFHYLLIFLFIHGFLHLASYNDELEKDRQLMIEKGEKLMKLLVKNGIIRENI